ncbi:AraC family transcriptional regulator [Salmonella enterica subsp. salamae]|uniref:Helix-turn-helix domain-containing protein n=2 Tax=Salmonella enterica TaxID=28901 RepID=A0A763MTC0_SALER|nr:helix-turn-helix domain-containing protein [Salmonella enterica subsp. salamae]EEO8344817.1 helix-turn-helix domain-containing protein [Salmonella enterica]ECI3454286.1 AraC family transcriptional regulator [Salmonella enterica subsp. salamae]ECJ2327124.1 helix-turn-helix domain-containing protein [Salmonella enterica subsp. salamae]HAG4415417.1 helix-turn-helix domain-containing protein [Salmonella enterica]
MTIMKILEFVDAHVESGRRTDISSISKYSGYSSRHIQRLFHCVTGMNIGEYVRRRRMTRAALLLRLSVRTIADISLSLGFDSQQSFNREFKKMTGYAPRQYRDAPCWPYKALIGRIARSLYDFSETEVVFMDGGTITGQEIISWGCIPYSPENGTVEALVDHVFSAIAGAGHELWLVTEIKATSNGKYDYRVKSGLGIPGGKTGGDFPFRTGMYFKTTFETTRETHMEQFHHIYLDLFMEKKMDRVNGADIMIFRREGERILCTVFIPVVSAFFRHFRHLL